MNNQTPPPTPDEEWAKKLGLNFDPEKAEQSQENDNELNEEASVYPSAPEPEFNSDSEPLKNRPAPPLPPPPAPQWQVPPHTPDAEKMPPTYMLWSVLALVCCCFPPAIAAIVYSAQVSSRFYAKDYEGAKKASERAQIWIIVSIVLGIVGAAVYIPFSLLSPS